MISLIIGFLVVQYVVAIPIDNGVEGDPEIECGANSITINFNVRNNFEGHVYVKGRFAEEGCRNDEGGRKVAGINLGFAACGTERTRSLNPRGVFVRQTVVISFHPQFLTKVDRAYTIQCFYMEADKTVSQQLEVSEITTQFQTQIVPMPVCRYDILDQGPTGQPVRFAIIGQQVYHKWTCDTETTDIFCMVVHDCFVDDGAGNRVTLLNEQGCGLDKHLLQNLEYTTDLMAGRESHVFKYADKAALFFTCQISITIKEPGAQCPRPQCPEPGGPGSAPGTGGAAVVPGQARPQPGPQPTRPPRPAGSPPPAGSPRPAGTPPPRPAGPTALPPAPLANRSRIRSRLLRDQFPIFRNKRSVDELGVIDVHAPVITTLDLDEDEASIQSLNRGQHPQQKPRIPHIPTQLLTSSSDNSYCMSPVSFGLMLTMAIVSVLTTVSFVILSCFKKSNKL